MKKLIISKTLLFLFIVLFISGFTSVFGEENSLIGVAIIIAMLMYLERDLTVHPWRSFFTLLGINLLQGIFGHLAAMNLWLGIPLNFIMMFCVGYFFTFHVKKSLYVIFGFQYVFILTTPVPTSDLPLRLLALASGAVIVMAVQLLANKDKLSRTGRKHLHTICDNLIEKLDNISNGHDRAECNQSIQTSIKELRKIIFFKRYKGYYLSHEGSLMLKISACLEKMDLLLNRFEEMENREEVIAACKCGLKNVKQFTDKEQLGPETLHVLHNIKVKKNSGMYINELAGSFELLFDLLEEIHATEKKELKKTEEIGDIPLHFKKTYKYSINFNRNSVAFTYAMRLGIMVTVAAFISAYFELEQGRWLVYTIFSVTQPYSEHAKSRFSARIAGTLTGVVIFVVLFSIFTDATSRLMIILLFGYLNSYAVQYRNVIITVTVSALGSAALIGDVNVITMERIIYVVVGVILGMIANRFIFPHSIQKGTATLVQIYKDTSKMLMEEVYKYFENNAHSHSINNLFAFTSFIEDRILLHNETLEWQYSLPYLEKQRKLNNGIYELFLRIRRNKIDTMTAKLIIEDIDQIMKSRAEEHDQIRKRLKNGSQNIVKIDDQIIVKDVIEIFEGFRDISRYPVEFKSRKA